MQKKISKLPFKGTAEQEAQLKAVIAENCHDKSNVMVVMQKAQDIYGYLPIEVQEMIAEGMGVPLEKVYGVSTFYAQFALSPKGQYNISVCLGTACYVKGSGDVLEKLKDARAEETYTDTPEYDDLECFLSVCDACGVEPLVVVQPVLGPYYDHIGISRETREAAYQRIRDIVAKHANARIADFSDREYERYFLFDIVHFGWTGWIDAEHAIYDFATGGSSDGAS